ncbi:MAG: hypothetical protein ACRDPH_12710 [Marmoricola sp.]
MPADPLGQEPAQRLVTGHQESFGPLGPIFATDQPASSAHTGKTLGWEPGHPRLLADLENLEA